jgi:hypothetical protein
MLPLTSIFSYLVFCNIFATYLISPFICRIYQTKAQVCDPIATVTGCGSSRIIPVDVFNIDRIEETHESLRMKEIFTVGQTNVVDDICSRLSLTVVQALTTNRPSEPSTLL